MPRQYHDRVNPADDPGDVRLRESTPDDLPVFFEQQRDPEAVRRANFPAREWKPFVAGNLVAWSQDDRRAVGY